MTRRTQCAKRAHHARGGCLSMRGQAGAGHCCNFDELLSRLSASLRSAAWGLQTVGSLLQPCTRGMSFKQTQRL